jgi:hypothetical protein
MPSFGSFLDQFGDGLQQGLFGSDYLKDYSHASKVFRSDNYSLAPQTKFLFHVYFNLNTAIPGLAKTYSDANHISQIGMMVKTADLPSFRIETDEMNQYNRKRNITKKVGYNPLSIVFHDDGSDLVRSMWYNYFRYYFADAGHDYDTRSPGNTPFDFNRRDIYDQLREVNDWGYTANGSLNGYKHNFFKDIKIYGLNRQNFVQYTLINPTITDWNHDTFSYSDTSGTMSNRMTIKFETVKYARGRIGGEDGQVYGFADNAMYDHERSKLSKGGTESILGPGGLLDIGNGVLNDLESGNFIGALVGAGRGYETFRNADLGSIAGSEGTALLGSLATGLIQSRPIQNSVSNFLKPKPSVQANNVPLGGATVSSNSGQTSATNLNTTNTTAQARPVSNANWSNPDDVVSNGSSVNIGPF